MASPNLVLPVKNSTLATLPSESVALAVMSTVAGAVNVALLPGEVRATVGGVLTGGGGGGGGGVPVQTVMVRQNCLYQGAAE